MNAIFALLFLVALLCIAFFLGYTSGTLKAGKEYIRRIDRLEAELATWEAPQE